MRIGLPHQCSWEDLPALFAILSAAAVFAARFFATRLFAPCRLPCVEVDDIGVFEYVADAHVDPLARGGRALAARKLGDE